MTRIEQIMQYIKIDEIVLNPKQVKALENDIRAAVMSSCINAYDMYAPDCQALTCEECWDKEVEE